MKRDALFLTGMLGSLVFVLTVVLGGAITPGYSHVRNAVSELTQRGARHAMLLDGLFIVSAVLMVVLGIATLRRLGEHNRRRRAGATLIIAYGVLAALLSSVFPQDPIGTALTFPGLMHLVVVGVSALLIVAAILLIGSDLDRPSGPWRHFRSYSIVSVLLMLGFGACTPVFIANGIDLLGVCERLTQLAYLQWFAVFSLKAYASPPDGGSGISTSLEPPMQRGGPGLRAPRVPGD